MNISLSGWQKRVLLALSALADASEETWINLRNQVGCCRHAKDAAFARAGFSPTDHAEADEFWPAQGFVAVRLGLA